MYQKGILRNTAWIITSCLLFLLLMELSRGIFFWLFPPDKVSSSVIFRGFILGLRYDLRIVAVPALLLFLVGLMPWANPYRNRNAKRFLLFIYGLFSCILLLFYMVDFANYAYLHQRLNATLLTLATDGKESFGMIWQTYPVIRMLLAGIILFLLIRLWLKKSFHWFADKDFGWKKGRVIMVEAGMGLLLCLAIFGRVGQYPLRWSDAFSIGDEYASNLSLNPLQSFVSSFKFRKITYDEQQVKAYYPMMAAYLGVDHPDPETLNYSRMQSMDALPGKKPNVVLVICESFSSYKSSLHGNPLNTTPFFKSLADSALYFDYCFSPTWGTARGVWAVITGVPDVDLGNTSSRNPNVVSQHSIINDFKDYEKYYFIGGSTSWANVRGFLSNSIDGLHIIEEADYKAPRIDVWGVSDKNEMVEAAGMLAHTDGKPFFAVIQTSDNHRPYTIPEEDRKDFKVKHVSPDSLKRFGFTSEDEYNAFRYTDYSFSKFIAAAKRESYFNNTIFVFVGDHGIRGDAGTMFSQAWTEELTCQHVPLVFYAPALIKPAVYHQFASQVDILPTIAALCNVHYCNTALGRNLMEIVAPEHKIPADSPMAFIFDPNTAQIGIVRDSLFYWQYINNTLSPKVYPLWHNNAVVLDAAATKRYASYTNGYYQTALYLLQHNRKLK